VAGEKTLVAAVVPRHADLSRAALRDYCNKALQKRDTPEIFQVLAEIPKTISEKPIERICIERLQESGLLG
jgi:crotonobetaine/carnitine-CoA ligase